MTRSPVGGSVLGIDPGKSGGIAVLHGSGSVEDVTRMPATKADLMAYLRPYAGCRVMIERVHATPQMGVVSAFTFGEGYGALCMAAIACELRADFVTPVTWQRALGCLSRGDKNVTKRRAQALFPACTVTHAIADALLIAEYGRRLHVGHVGDTQKEKTR